MGRLSLISRLLLISMLVFLVSVAGFFPALVGSVNARPAVAVEQSAELCCCGQQGECCGMACCGTSAPKPDQSPAPAKSQQEQPVPVQFAFMKAVALLHRTSGQGQNGFDASRSLVSSGTASLQAQQIRLQV